MQFDNPARMVDAAAAGGSHACESRLIHLRRGQHELSTESVHKAVHNSSACITGKRVRRDIGWKVGSANSQRSIPLPAERRTELRLGEAMTAAVATALVTMAVANMDVATTGMAGGAIRAHK
jgi:hypothetical protein